MNQLITILQTNFNNEVKQSVNARDLHSFLESKQDFSTWVKNRLSDFEENLDFIRLHKKMEANNATLIEYFLTLDTAKEISMLERNEKGKQARRYFIEMEKQAKQTQNQIQVPTNMKEALLLALQLEEEKERLELENKQLSSEVSDLGNKVSVLSAIHEIEHDLRGLQEYGVALNLHPNKFIKKLKQLGYLKNGIPVLPYQEWINQKLFTIKVISYKRYSDDRVTEKATSQTYVTQKGYIHFQKLISSNPKEWIVIAGDSLKSKFR